MGRNLKSRLQALSEALGDIEYETIIIEVYHGRAGQKPNERGYYDIETKIPVHRPKRKRRFY